MEVIPQEVVIAELYPYNDGYIYSLPGIWDENGEERVYLEIAGLNESFSRFDSEKRQI